MLQPDTGCPEILRREQFKTVSYCRMLQRRRGAFFSSPLKIHLSLDISILDISLAPGGLLEKAARIELIQPQEEGYPFCQLVRNVNVPLCPNIFAET